MDADIAAYLKQVKRRRSELGESMAALQGVLDERGDDERHWLNRARAAVMEVRHDLDEHIAVTEGPGGLYEGVRDDAARLAGPLRHLQGEHPELIALADDLVALLHDPGAVDLAAAPRQIRELLRRLSHHRQRGGDLIFEAYQVDVGGAG